MTFLEIMELGNEGEIEMNRKELVKEISDIINEGVTLRKDRITQNDIDRIITAFTDIIADAMVKREDVKLTGFGTFTTVKRAPRKGRNPQTGEIMSISEMIVPRFKPSVTLRKFVR